VLKENMTEDAFRKTSGLLAKPITLLKKQYPISRNPKQLLSSGKVTENI
jgi:hypothetical protein